MTEDGILHLFSLSSGSHILYASTPVCPLNLRDCVVKMSYLEMSNQPDT